MKRVWLNRYISGWLLLLVLACTGCLGPKRGLFPPAAGQSPKPVFLVRHGWHTGLVIKRADIPQGLLPEQADFPKEDYLEVGWGDDAFYRAEKVTVGITFKALFWCDRSVLHVVGFAGPVQKYFPREEIVQIDLSERGHAKLCEFVSNRFKRDSAERAPPLQAGLYGDSYFYRANGRYYCVKTCNMWTARALRAAGCPITPAYAINAGNLVWQARRFGKVVQPKAPD